MEGGKPTKPTACTAWAVRFSTTPVRSMQVPRPSAQKPPSYRRQGRAQPLLVVGDPSQAVFAPAVGSRTGLVVAEAIPRVAALAVVLTNGSPLALAQVGSPPKPWNYPLPSLVHGYAFSRDRYLLWLSPRSWKGRSRSKRATIQYNSLERLSSSDFKNSLPEGRLAARESRSPAIWSRIAYPESCAFSLEDDPTERPTGLVDFDWRVWFVTPHPGPPTPASATPGSNCRRLGAAPSRRAPRCVTL